MHFSQFSPSLSLCPLPIAFSLWPWSVIVISVV